LYLRLTRDPLAIEAPELEAATKSLSRFLAPIMFWELVELPTQR